MYLGKDQKLKRKVALKLPPEAMAKSPERIARFHDPRFRDLLKRVGIPEGANPGSGSG